MTSLPNIHVAAPLAKRQAKTWVETLARCGYAARGVVYVVIGALAFKSALNAGGRTTDAQGALHTIAGQPLGRLLLILVGVGLLGYAIWRFVEASVDPEGKGSNAKGIAQRLGSVLSGLAYTSLAFTAFRIIMGSGGNRGPSQQEWTARLLAQPWGVWLVTAVAMGVIGAGLHAFIKAYNAKFRDKLMIEKMDARKAEWITRLGRAGYGARGIVWILIGWFLFNAARHSNPKESGGLSKALDTLAAQPYGPWLLGHTAVGLVAYGLYALAESRYRKIYL